MGLTEAYLVAAGNLPSILDAIKSARAPEKFSLRFLEDMGFKSTNDRLIIPLLKGLRFLDDNGAPTQRYFDFLDDNQSARVLADGIRDAYEDLFRINKRAYSLPKNDLAGKLKSLTEGKKSEKVIENMVRTFLALSKLADFSEESSRTKAKHEINKDDKAEEAPVEKMSKLSEEPQAEEKSSVRLIDAVTYRIEIVLPSVRDKAVYDAIFRSLKEHLL
jgi:hypothetical protein